MKEIDQSIFRAYDIRGTYPNGLITELDGLTVEFDDLWFNQRPSQTEPMLRLNVEAKTQEMLDTRVA